MSTPSTAIDPARSRSTLRSPGQVRRVILLCPDLHEVGGIGLLSRLTLQALQSYGAATNCRGEVWSYHHPPTSEAISQAAGWPIRYAGGRRVKAALWGLKAGLTRAQDTLVVVTHLHLAPLALPLVKRGARLAVFLCGIEAWVPLSELRTRALDRSEPMLAISDHTTRRFKKSNPHFANRSIQTCLLGVPESEPAATPIAMTEPFALIVGRLSSQERYKGHDTLLQLWRELTRVCPTARLVIAGDGDDRTRLENKARELGITDAVSFQGRVTSEKLTALYRDCSFFVMPSSEEGFGLVFLEAMRAGKACLAAKGAAEEVVENGVTGLIVPAGDRKALLTSIMRLFQDPELTAQMGRAGRDRYLERFTQTHFEKRLLAALDLQPRTGES